MSYPREDGAGAPYMPTPKELAERTEMVRRSWFDPELRAEMGLNAIRILRVDSEEQDDDRG